MLLEHFRNAQLLCLRLPARKSLDRLLKNDFLAPTRQAGIPGKSLEVVAREACRFPIQAQLVKTRKIAPL